MQAGAALPAVGRPRVRSIRLFGSGYTVVPPSLRDPRLHVAAVLLTVQLLGQTKLGFRVSVAQILTCLATAALIEVLVAFFKDRSIIWPASGLLTGNSVALILRVPGTLHGDWWSRHGIEIFIGVVAVSMASKYLIRWRGQHLFNPANFGLVLAFVLLGPRLTEPLDLWWVPPGPWLGFAYLLLVVGGVLIGARLGLLGMQVAYMAGLAVFLAFALAWEPDHCLVASWHLAPICGLQLWQIVVTSPEVLIFALFMVPDPRTVPAGRFARIGFGLSVALLSVLLLGPTSLEFWTKTAILASLTVACPLRFPVAALLARRDPEEPWARAPNAGWRAPAAVFLAIFSVGFLPLSADLSTRSPQPAAGLTDGTIPTVPLAVGAGPAPGAWLRAAAGGALPQQGTNRIVARASSARLYRLPVVPAATIPANVRSFDAGITSQRANQMARDIVLDLLIEADARRSWDPTLAATAAIGRGLTPFSDDITRDRSAGVVVTTTYSFDHVALELFLPKFTTQASRLLGVTLTGTATLITTDGSGHQISERSTPYVRSWSILTLGANRTVIDNDFTGLVPAP